MTIYSILHKIQKSIHAPKEKNNDFAKFKYRNCDDILRAIKVHLPEGVCIIMSDEIVMLGSRFYVKATATIHAGESGSISTTAFAREEETKKGMDGSQISGSASSYSRKYALCALFAIDDTKTPPPVEYEKDSPDPDSDEFTEIDLKAFFMESNTPEDLKLRWSTQIESYKGNASAQSKINKIVKEVKALKFP